jgi:16S rRNA (guanine527-N7)-methyltransferase
MQLFIAELAGLGFQPTDRQLEQFEIYYREMVDWNERVNLTAISSYEDVHLKHFVDSLTVTMVVKRPDPDLGLKIIDVGSGAGLPGIPLKIMWPEIKLTLLEATHKKALFLGHALKALGLTEVEVVSGRAEDVAHALGHREAYDVALSRAVAALPTLLELTLPFCRIGGLCVAQKQAEATPEIEMAARAASVLGGSLMEVLDINLSALKKRCLIVYLKTAATPPQYPRRAGTPGKRPL